MNRPMRLAAVVAAVGLMVSCSKQLTDDQLPATRQTTFGLIQERILTPSCATAGCHAAEADASFRQHGLVLAAGVAYKNLVGVDPKNAQALTDGLKRVKSFESANSLLYHKLNVAATHHAGKDYGNPMPLGRELLSVGQIEFVRRWIEGGAESTGNQVDPALLDDTTPSVTTNFVVPEAPAAGQGYQLRIAPFDIKPNFERELFVRRSVGNTEDVYVNRYTINMRPGSHHFLAYDFENKALAPPMDQVRDLRAADGSLNIVTAIQMSNHVYLAGSQTSGLEYTFPVGAALLIPASASVDLNAHYVNKGTTTSKGEAYLNLYTVPKANVTKVVRTLNLNNTNLSIPAGQEMTFQKSFLVTAKTRYVLSLTSHMHKLGTKFVVRIKGGARNGEIVYTTTDWEHPSIVNFKTPIVLAKGEGLTSEITYKNTTSKTVNFGLTSDDEMGIIFGYYYEE